jgi:hypothetical protein
VEIEGKEVRTSGRLIRTAFLDGEGYQFLRNPETALRAVRRSDVRADLFTFIQRLSEPEPKYAYTMELDNMAALPVSTFDDWMAHQVNNKVRNMVRKAGKNGVAVRETEYDDAFVKGIHSIYNECPVRQGKRFWHYGKGLEFVRRMNGTFMDRSIFIGAFLQDNLIGFAKLVADEEWHQAGLMQIISMVQHRDKAPTNALIAQAVRSCAERRISHLWYANFSYGRKQHDSLAEFKKHNGFQKIDVPRYYVPLTMAGRLALSLGLHHGMIEWVPEPLGATYRRIRSLWHRKRTLGLQDS